MASKGTAAETAQPTVDISLWEKLDFLPATLVILFGTVKATILAPFRGSHAPKTLKQHVVLSVMRLALDRLSHTQLQWKLGTTVSNYTAWAKAGNIKPQIIALPDQSKAVWVGDPGAETVNLYLHGGGFCLSADSQFDFLSHINATAARSGKSLAFLILQYDLAPGKQYPHQLRQAVEMLRYAATHLGSKQLMLGGDSAGGSLVFGALLHLLYPHPEIAPLKLQRPLRAAFVASPWLDFDMTSERYHGSDAYDAASVNTLKTWARNYLGTSKPDLWREPAKVKDWQGLEDMVDDILITIAKEEVMADDVKLMAASIEKSYPKVKLFAAAEDFHAEPALGAKIGSTTGEAAKMIESWVVEKC